MRIPGESAIILLGNPSITAWIDDIPQYSFLVTGSAGFIGFHVSRYLLQQGARVIGLDNFNDYYSPALKMDLDREL